MAVNLEDKIFSTAVVIVLVIIGVILWGTLRPAEDMLNDGGQDVTQEKTINTGGTSSQNNGSGSSGAVSKSIEIDSHGRYIIRYKDSGFSPAALTVPAGTQVRFVNDSDKAMSVHAVSAYNPYVNLNQSFSIGRGGIYDFTFLPSGLWEYYNLNNPEDKGTVIAY